MIATASEKAERRVRAALANRLAGVIAQELLLRKGGGCVVARELLLRSLKLTAALVDDEPSGIHAALEGGESAGMQTLDGALLDLVQREKIEIGQARERGRDKKAFMR